MTNPIRFQRGVLFTFLTFLFIGLLVALVVFNAQLGNRASTNTVEVSVLSAINAKYDDVTDDIITLDTAIGVPGIQQRILPFTYETDGNTAEFVQTLPIASGKLALYFDLLNAYAIFVQDQNVSRTYDGVNVSISVPRSPAWGGTAQRAGFNILPQCVQYIVADVNSIYFENQNTIGCANQFDFFSSIARIEITLSTPTSVDDYNRVSCTFEGTAACPHQDFNAELGKPYLSILFNDANCTQCALSTLDKNIAGHLVEEGENTFTYSCTGSDCTSLPLILSTSNGFRITHGGSPIVASIRILFRESISTFYYQDANYSVTKPGFNTTKSNVVVFPQ